MQKMVFYCIQALWLYWGVGTQDHISVQKSVPTICGLQMRFTMNLKKYGSESTFLFPSIQSHFHSLIDLCAAREGNGQWAQLLGDMKSTDSASPSTPYPTDLHVIWRSNKGSWWWATWKVDALCAIPYLSATVLHQHPTVCRMCRAPHSLELGAQSKRRGDRSWKHFLDRNC